MGDSSITPPLIWMYWEGSMPGYIQLCIETVKKHYPFLSVLGPEEFSNLWITDKHVPINHLGPHHRSDFVRAYLLSIYGGLWLDADFVLLKPLDDIFILPEQFTFCGYVEYSNQYANNFLYSRKDDSIVGEFYASVRDHLVARKPIDWLEIGSYPLTSAIRNNSERAYQIPTDMINPIPWNEMSRFEQPGDAANLMPPWRYGVMLSNNSISTSIKKMTPQEVIESNILLGDLLRRALD